MSLTTFQPKAKIALLFFILIIGFTVTGYFGKDIVLQYFAKASSCPVKDLKIENIASNSAQISFNTDEDIQSRIEYGIDPSDLSSSVPETVTATNHMVTIPSLSSGKDYYFTVAVGIPGKLPGTTDTLRCDSLGQTCTEDSCSPWQFKTEKTASPSASLKPSVSVAAPTSSLSSFCQRVRSYIGRTSKDSSWSASIKQYDVDGNGVVNGLDIIKCPKTGK